MANEPDEALEERIDRIQRRAENFRDFLKDGEVITIALLDGEVKVAESYQSQFERKHTKLFGRLMSLEAQLAPGWVPYFVGMLATGVLLLGLELRWWEVALGRGVCDLLSAWWFYVGLAASVIYLVSLGCGQWQKRVYRRQRHGLLDLIAGEKLDRDILLVMLREVDDLDNVVQELKLDPGPFSSPG